MNIILIALVLSSVILMISSHPVTILTLIVIQALNICLTTWILMKTSWFSYILFLIFLGGLMVLFVYIVSLASNEKFEPLLEETSLTTIMFISITMIMLLASFFNKTTSQPSQLLYLMLMTVYSKNIVYATILIMTYLLLALVIAVKISSKFEGPLRNFIK